MTRHAKIRAAGTLACLLFCGGAAVAGSVTQKKANSSTYVELEEVAADPAGVWDRFLARAVLGDAYKAYDLIDEVMSDSGSVDADLCRDLDAALHDAVREVPVSIALHRTALQCAEVLGDDKTAERETLALAALSKHALSGDVDSIWRKPIQVLSPRDAYALVGLLGYEFRYEYYRNTFPQRYFPLVVAAWDTDAKVERHLLFDFVDVVNTIDRGDVYSGYPYQRHLLANAFIEGQAKSGEIAALDATAIREARTAKDGASRIAKLREATTQGGLSAAVTWLVLCGSEKIDRCSDGMVDALLPLAEREHAVPTALLAAAYVNGLGVKQDMTSAKALLDVADKRWHQRGASVYYAAVDSLMRDGKYGDFAIERLNLAKDAGNSNAELLLLVARMQGDEYKLTTNDVQILERSSSNGMGAGYATLAEYYAKHRDERRKLDAIRKAADSGHPGSQAALAIEAIRSSGSRDLAKESLSMLRSAAHGGDAIAMRILAGDAAQKESWKDAAAWLFSAVEMGDIESLFAIAAIYATEIEGLPGGVKEAIEVYKALAEDPGKEGARARRQLAHHAIRGHGMKQDPLQAKAWLLKDAEGGDIESQFELGSLYLHSYDGWVPDPVVGQHWLAKAIAAGSNEARGGLAAWLHRNTASSVEDRQRAVKLLREADPAGEHHDDVMNNLAWMLCVSPFVDIRDPAAGLAIAKEMEKQNLDPGAIDTVAACYAATGDFSSAKRLQQKAIDQLPRDAKGKPQGNQGYFDRLKLYKADKAYIETVE